MRKIFPRIKALLGFTKLSDADLVSRLNAAHDGLKGNPAFPNPPVDIVVFKATIDTYAAAVAEAIGGGTKALTERDSQRHAAIAVYEQLAHYVQAHCNNDLATFASSGFIPATRTRSSDVSLAQPGVTKIEQGISGQLKVAVSSVSKALHYELRYAAIGEANVPGSWTTAMLTTRKPTSINGLKPATTYTFQVRAFRKSGYTDWSDFASRMCI